MLLHHIMVFEIIPLDNMFLFIRPPQQLPPYCGGISRELVIIQMCLLQLTV